MIEALQKIGNVSLAAFLGMNVLLQFFLYPFYLLFASLERMYITDDERRSLKLFDNFWVDVWIPVSKGTIAFSVICGVVGTLLLCLRLVVNQMV